MPTSSATFPSLAPRGTSAPAPLSFAQELLWLMDRASPGLTAWNVPRAFRLRGAVDRGALSRALDALVSRHSALRTIFVERDGEARQVAVADVHVELPQVDLSAVAGDAQRKAITQHIRDFAHTPFDLTRDVLLRAALIRCAVDEHVLCLNTHHIVSDGWSKSVMFRELTALYDAETRGASVELPELSIQFADYATWERDPARERELEPSLVYWRKQLAGPLPTLEFPTDFPRPAAPGFGGARRVMVLPRPLVDAVARLAREQGVTSYMVLLAAYVTLLHRQTGQTDIIVGSPIAGRAQAETEELIGYFANTLVLRERLDGNPTFAELLARVRDTAVDAYDNQDVPFEKLVLELQKGQHLTHAPLFQAVLTMEDTMPARLAFAGVDVSPVDIEDGSTKFDLTLLVGDQADGLRLSLWYRTDLFLPETADRLLAQLRRILEAAVAEPTSRIDEIEIVSPEDRNHLLEMANGPVLPSDGTPLHVKFAEAAARFPDRIGLRAGDLTLTLAELDGRAGRLARRLADRGVARGDAVALVLDRSADAIVALLAILKAGGAYVPIAPDAPRARVAQQIADAGARAAVVDGASRDRLPAGLAVIDVSECDTGAPLDPAPVALDEPAYVLFTSGSTGVPKGVVVTHGNVLHYTRAIIDRLGVSESVPWAFATASSLTADLGNTAILPALATGGTLDVIPADVVLDASRFVDHMRSHAIDVLKITPGHFRALTAALSPGELASILPHEWLVFGGETLQWELADRVRAAGRCRVLNHYGPTESTVGACAFEITFESSEAARAAGGRTVPIGAPLAATRCYVLDGSHALVPRGAVGELFIGGAGVARGYARRPELTAERFTADPYQHDGRMYRTGDRVRWLRSGVLEFLGRVDHQVKIRGYRVELAEIERALAEHPGVAQSAVVVRSSESAGDDAQLFAYVAPHPRGYAAAYSGAVDEALLTGWLAERLPQYMLPSAITVLDTLPLGANGKLDRTALPAPARREYAAESPATETEVAIAAIWSDVLKREGVSATDNFLALGGHSLLAIRVLGRLSKQFGVRLPLRTLFEAPTVRELATIVDAELRAVEARELEAMLTAVEGMTDADAKRMTTSGPAD